MTSSRARHTTDFSRCDLFGQTIAFTFKGQAEYRSVFGSFMSVASVIVFAVFFGIRTKSLFSGETAFMFKTDMPMNEQAFDLIQLGFYFTVEEIPREIGKIKLEAFSIDSDREQDINLEDGVTGIQVVDIPMLPCSTISNENERIDQL